VIKVFLILLIYIIQCTLVAQERPFNKANLIGKTKVVVMDSLRNRNIKYEVIEQESEEDSGKVIKLESQNYVNSQRDSLIQVIVAVPKLIVMPNLLNRSIEQARMILNEYKLVLRTATERESDTQPNIILEQEPKAGVKIKAGSLVDLIVSKQRQTIQTVAMPDLINKTISAARELLNQRKLQLGLVDSMASDQVPNTIISQSPEAYTKVEVGSTVNVIVSKQEKFPEPVEVPNLINLKLEQARELINRVGLQLGQVKEEESNKAPNLVLSQNPEAHTKVDSGSVVDLIISKEVMPVAFPRIELAISDTNPEPNQNVKFDVKVIPETENVEFLFNYGDQQTSGWTNLSTTYHSYTKEYTYTAYVSARIRERILLKSKLVEINIVSPINWAGIIAGVLSFSLLSLFTYNKVIKPRRIRKIFHQMITVKPQKQFGKQEIKTDSNEIPSFSIRIKPIADSGKQRIKII
jgi:beta-lactam-binding protein with PASTA domain